MLSQVQVASEEYRVRVAVAEGLADSLQLQVAEVPPLSQGLQVRRRHEEAPVAALQVQAHGHKTALHLRG